MLTQAYLQHFLHLANLFLPFLFVIQYGVDDFCIHNQVFKRSADVDGVNVVVNNLNGLYPIVLPTTCSFFSFLANTTLIRLRCLLPILLLCIMYIQATNVQVFCQKYSFKRQIYINSANYLEISQNRQLEITIFIGKYYNWVLC